MIQYISGMLCEFTIISQQTEQMSLINVVEGFNVSKLPVSIPRLELVLNWRRPSKDTSDKQAKARIFFKNSSGESISEKKFAFELSYPTDKKRMRTIIDLSGTALSTSGETTIVIELSTDDKTWQEVGQVVFDVNEVPTPQETTKLAQ